MSEENEKAGSAVDTFLRDADVTRVTGIPRSTRYEMIERGEFPEGIPLSERSVAWSTVKISEWQRQRIEARDDKSGEISKWQRQHIEARDEKSGERTI